MYSKARYRADRKRAAKPVKKAGQKFVKDFSLTSPFNSMWNLVWLIFHGIFCLIRTGINKIRLILS